MSRESVTKSLEKERVASAKVKTNYAYAKVVRTPFMGNLLTGTRQESSTRFLTGSLTMFGQSTLQKQLQGQNVVQRQITREITQQKLVTEPLTPFITEPKMGEGLPFMIPPFIPPFKTGGGGESGTKKGNLGNRGYEYKPTLAAAMLGITTRKTPTGRWTGFETIRPIVSNYNPKRNRRINLVKFRI
jgi:hypothetical protein